MHKTEDRSFIGHPRGLAFLAFTEAWEHFSYYGMQSLLVLYMVNRLLHPGHIERIAGFGPFRSLLESIRPEMAQLPPSDYSPTRVAKAYGAFVLKVRFTSQ